MDYDHCAQSTNTIIERFLLYLDLSYQDFHIYGNIKNILVAPPSHLMKLGILEAKGSYRLWFGALRTKFTIVRDLWWNIWSSNRSGSPGSQYEIHPQMLNLAIGLQQNSVSVWNLGPKYTMYLLLRPTSINWCKQMMHFCLHNFFFLHVAAPQFIHHTTWQASKHWLQLIFWYTVWHEINL